VKVPDEPFEVTSALHAVILGHIVKTGRAPSLPELATALQRRPEEVRAGLRLLQHHHGVVMHPNGEDIWIIHPFSLAPTAFWVNASSGGWWGCCTWCSLGIAALVKQPLTIRTTVAGQGEPLDISVEDDEVVPRDLVVHFPVPAARAWDNVVFYCSTVLPFRSVEDVSTWSHRHGFPQGAIIPIPQVWALAKEWYGGYLSPTWRKHSVKQAATIFERVGLRGETWRLPESKDRF